MKVHKTKFFTITIVSLLAFVMVSGVCSAQDRSGKTELFGTYQMMEGDGDVLGVTVDFEGQVYGVGFGYNIDNHWNVNTDILFGSTDVEALGIDIGDMDLWLWNVNVDYNILEGAVTPLVTAGIGLLGADFGGVSETNFTYNWGVGGRWDISDNMLLKVIYRVTYHEFEGMDGPDFDGVMVSFGLKW